MEISKQFKDDYEYEREEIKRVHGGQQSECTLHQWCGH